MFGLEGFSIEDVFLYLSRSSFLTKADPGSASDPWASRYDFEASGSFTWTTALDQFGPALLRDRLKVAVEGPLTGSQANNGQDILRSARLAAEQINRAGGVNGRLIQLVPADDQADPARALPVAKKAAARGARAVIGPYNSSVGVRNLPLYEKLGIVPLHLTSSNETDGRGVTIQPKNNQISPPEVDYIESFQPRRVAMLVDPSAYTTGMADRNQQALEADGVEVLRIAVPEGLSDYSAVVSRALESQPDVLYVSTYYPEGSIIARDLAALKTGLPVLFGLANVDLAFVQAAGLEASRLDRFSGVPDPSQLPTASVYVEDYITRFKEQPGVWGTFAYDSLNLWARDVEQLNTAAYGPVLKALRKTQGYEGQTGEISIDPITGNRLDLPIYILEVNEEGVFVIDQDFVQ